LITFRCTAKLAKRFGLDLNAGDNATPTSLLGDWYANLFNHGAQRWVLCLSEKTNLPVLVRARKSDFPEEFPVELGLVLRAIGVPGEVAARESQQSSEFRFGKTLNRRILGSLNDMAYHMSWELERRDGDSVAAAAVLSEMPCRQPNFIVPGEEAFSLLGISSQYDRKRIDQMYFPEFSARWHV
jgi:hypothetical protein